ncbi:MAG TPA: hypothetical protein VLG10_14275 [Methylomirabilota bacterium]|nr:hypothetical protein [Methylomirabilota bacterium]
MDARATGLDLRVTTPGATGGDAGSPRETVRQRQAEVTALQEDLGQLVSELDRRRREALDVKLQLRRHGPEIALTSVALVGAAAGLVWLSIWRDRRRQRLGARLGRVQSTLSRAIAGPARGGAEPPVIERIAVAAANAAAAILIRKVLERVVHHVTERRRPAETAQLAARPESPTAA